LWPRSGLDLRPIWRDVSTGAVRGHPGALPAIVLARTTMPRSSCRLRVPARVKPGPRPVITHGGPKSQTLPSWNNVTGGRSRSGLRYKDWEWDRLGTTQIYVRPPPPPPPGNWHGNRRLAPFWAVLRGPAEIYPPRNPARYPERDSVTAARRGGMVRGLTFLAAGQRPLPGRGMSPRRKMGSPKKALRSCDVIRPAKRGFRGRKLTSRGGKIEEKTDRQRITRGDIPDTDVWAWLDGPSVLRGHEGGPGKFEKLPRLTRKRCFHSGRRRSTFIRPAGPKVDKHSDRWRGR